MFAALAASATHLAAQTTKDAKTLQDVKLEPLSETRAAQAQPLEYERSVRVQPGLIEQGIAKTIGPDEQPLEALAPASATTRLEQGTGTHYTAPMENRPAAASRSADAEGPAPPLVESEPELPAAPKSAVAKPEVVAAPVAREPVVPEEPATLPAPVAAAAPDDSGAIAPPIATEASPRLTPISMSRSFGRVVKAKDADAAPVAAHRQEAASVGVQLRGRSSRPAPVPRAATQPEASASLTFDGTETAAALLAGTAPAGSTLVAQRSAAQRYVERPWSYISLGGNFGLIDDGKTELSDTAFVINSKIGLANYLSIRPAALLGDRATFLVPLTYDLAIGGSDPFRPATFVPYLGGGFLLTTHDGSNFGPLVSGGMDIRVSESMVINAGLNAGFLRDETELGILLGVGYIFPTDPTDF